MRDLSSALRAAYKKYGKQLTDKLAAIFGVKPKSRNSKGSVQLKLKKTGYLVVGYLYRITYKNLKGEKGSRFIIPTSCDRTGEASCLYQSKKTKRIIAAAFNVSNPSQDSLVSIVEGLQEIDNLSYQDKELIESLGPYEFHNFFLNEIRNIERVSTKK